MYRSTLIGTGGPDSYMDHTNKVLPNFPKKVPFPFLEIGPIPVNMTTLQEFCHSQITKFH